MDKSYFLVAYTHSSIRSFNKKNCHISTPDPTFSSLYPIISCFFSEGKLHAVEGGRGKTPVCGESKAQRVSPATRLHLSPLQNQLSESRQSRNGSLHLLILLLNIFSPSRWLVSCPWRFNLWGFGAKETYTFSFIFVCIFSRLCMLHMYFWTRCICRDITFKRLAKHVCYTFGVYCFIGFFFYHSKMDYEADVHRDVGIWGEIWDF